jgi:hypothetical protein
MVGASFLNHIHLKYHQVLQFVAGMGVFAERIPVDYVVRTVVHVLFVESALVQKFLKMNPGGYRNMA